MTFVRLFLVVSLAACVKPTSVPASRSNYDFYHLCGDANADGVCGPATETGMKVDTNFATHARGVVEGALG
jgi:hypothetical protein